VAPTKDRGQVQRVVDGLGFLGLVMDADRNAAADGDAVVGADTAAAHTVVVSAREDLVIAEQVRGVLVRTVRRGISPRGGRSE
ncbi:MAG: hypothetical protein L0H64_08980, partial [Pseudonocardia sp.]|nr:hypothetical protein [Pseudonocardia sp.]